MFLDSIFALMLFIFCPVLPIFTKRIVSFFSMLRAISYNWFKFQYINIRSFAIKDFKYVFAKNIPFFKFFFFSYLSYKLKKNMNAIEIIKKINSV